MDLAQLSDVSVQRARRVLLGPMTLTVRRGEFVGIVGPNGAGKSTFLRVLAGVQRPSSGRLLVDGVEIWGSRAHRLRLRRQTGYLLQRHDQAAKVPFTVADVVRFGLAGLPAAPARPEADARLAESLERVGLAGFARRLYQELSGGEQQRVQLARLWAREAEVLLLDEPTAGLDPDQRERVTRSVQDLHGAGGRTVVMVTHELAALPSCVSRVLLLRDGALLADGPPATVLREDILTALYGCPLRVSSQGGRHQLLAAAAEHETEGVP